MRSNGKRNMHPMKIVESMENEDDKMYICQYVVSSGGNDDPPGKCGISHLIEHYLIHCSCHAIHTKYVRVHGFTSFYYTCYYWYISDIQEAKDTAHKFEDIINNIKNGSHERNVFENTKKEIVDEIELRSGDNEKVSELLDVLYDGKSKMQLPIGKIADIKEMVHSDMVDHLRKQYRNDKICTYIYDRKYNTFILNNLELEKAAINKIGIQNKMKNTNKENKIKVTPIMINENENNIKIIYEDSFKDGIFDIIIGEIFMMQLCEYLEEKVKLGVEVSFEKFFFNQSEMFFLIIVNQTDFDRYVDIIKKEIYDVEVIMNEVLNEKRFKEIISAFTNYLKNYKNVVEEKEIRLELINYFALAYDSYNLISGKKRLVNELGRMEYTEYNEYVLNKMRMMKNREIKIIFG